MAPVVSTVEIAQIIKETVSSCARDNRELQYLLLRKHLRHPRGDLQDSAVSEVYHNKALIEVDSSRISHLGEALPGHARSKDQRTSFSTFLP
eukprot:Skav207335  [mRNA]  locus=scaffold3027:403173:407252:+ [translate_table: standard]